MIVASGLLLLLVAILLGPIVGLVALIGAVVVRVLFLISDEWS